MGKSDKPGVLTGTEPAPIEGGADRSAEPTAAGAGVSPAAPNVAGETAAPANDKKPLNVGGLKNVFLHSPTKEIPAAEWEKPEAKFDPEKYYTEILDEEPVSEKTNKADAAKEYPNNEKYTVRTIIKPNGVEEKIKNIELEDDIKPLAADKAPKDVTTLGKNHADYEEARYLDESDRLEISLNALNLSKDSELHIRSDKYIQVWLGPNPGFRNHPLLLKFGRGRKIKLAADIVYQLVASGAHVYYVPEPTEEGEGKDVVVAVVDGVEVKEKRKKVVAANSYGDRIIIDYATNKLTTRGAYEAKRAEEAKANKDANLTKIKQAAKGEFTRRLTKLSTLKEENREVITDVITRMPSVLAFASEAYSKSILTKDEFKELAKQYEAKMTELHKKLDKVGK